MQGATTVHERTIIHKNSEKCVSEESRISVESGQTIVKTISSQESANNNWEVQEVIGQCKQKPNLTVQPGPLMLVKGKQ